jgi:hypothetical protein
MLEVKLFLEQLLEKDENYSPLPLGKVINLSEKLLD